MGSLGADLEFRLRKMNTTKVEKEILRLLRGYVPLYGYADEDVAFKSQKRLAGILANMFKSEGIAVRKEVAEEILEHIDSLPHGHTPDGKTHWVSIHDEELEELRRRYLGSGEEEVNIVSKKVERESRERGNRLSKMLFGGGEEGK